MCTGRKGRFRTRFGLPRVHVARAAGLADSTMGYWDRGATTPTLQNLLRVADALQNLGHAVPMEELVNYYAGKGMSDE